MTNEHGYAAEDDVRHIASVLGLPDFVFTVPPHKKGTAVREVGDALLIANSLGAVVQVKARRPDASGNGADWLRKKGLEAVRQAHGSKRTIVSMRNSGTPLIAVPVRATGLEAASRAKTAMVLDSDVRAWPVVVVVDHPGIVGQQPPDSSVFWITLDDWRNLMKGLRSVTSLLTYVNRVLAASPPAQVPLGSERDRFVAMAETDAAAGEGGWLTLDVYTNPVASQIYREIVERVWPDQQALPAASISDYRSVIEYLDWVPPSVIPVLGEWILLKRRVLSTAGKSSGIVFMDSSRALVYLARRWREPHDEEMITAFTFALATVRCSEISAQAGSSVPVLAVAQLVKDNGEVTYRFVLVREPMTTARFERSLVAHNFGELNLGAGSIQLASATSSGECSCGSGRSYGQCEAEMAGWW